MILYNKEGEKMFKVKNRKTEEIVQVLDAYCDGYGKTWFLLWVKDKWCWRAADMFVPPNYVPKKKLIIAGSRSFNNFKLIRSVLDGEVDIIEEVVCGEAQGADSYGKAWARYHNIPVKSFPADWSHDGSAAGYIRNHKMGDYADELIAFWDGTSPGTKEMIEYMRSLGKPVRIIDF
jgi:hypothetical protein